MKADTGLDIVARALAEKAVALPCEEGLKLIGDVEEALSAGGAAEEQVDHVWMQATSDCLEILEDAEKRALEKWETARAARSEWLGQLMGINLKDVCPLCYKCVPRLPKSPMNVVSR